MKKMYLGALVTSCLLFAVTYYASVRSNERPELTTDIQIQSTAEIVEKTSEALQPAAQVQEPFVTEQMQYFRIVENELTGEEEIFQDTMPAYFLGLRRNEIIDYLQELTKISYGESDVQERIHFELISFSSAGVTVKETITANPAVYECFVIAEGEFVNIYTADRTSLYLDTMLYRDDFSEDVQEDLARGIYMTTVMDLYDFLQNHTS